MLIFKKRYDLLELSKTYRLPKVYDLLNTIKNEESVPVAATDGASIVVNIDEFNNLPAESEFFILCHELLHILYHHLDKDYYPEDIYANRELLNMCQDVVINEFLAKRLKYKEPNGLYLDNIAKALYDRGRLKYSNLKYQGILTTKSIYNFFIKELDDYSIEQLLDDLNYDSSEDRLEQDEDITIEEQQRLQDAICNIKKSLRINDDLLQNENRDRRAGVIEGRDGKTIYKQEVKTISTKDMIEYINQFIGNNAVTKGRHRTYTRPSRRVALQNNMLAPGYKHYKNINKISIYLDVSGSMPHYLVETLYKTLKLLYKTVTFDFYTFTTSIEKIDIKNTSYIYTGGGTDINKVLKNIETEKQDTAILITDCEDNFSLKNVKSNLMIYTNNTTFKNDNNPLVKLTYFKD